MYELYFEDHNLKNYFYVFISDIALNFRTSFIDKSGHVVYDGRLIVKHYVKGWFLLDLLAAIPFDLMFLFNRFSKLNTVSSLYAMYKRFYENTKNRIKTHSKKPEYCHLLKEKRSDTCMC